VNSRLPPIYLVSNEVWNQGYFSPPLGIMFVGKALSQAGYSVRLFHLHQGEEKLLYQAILDQPPLFVGFSTIIGSTLKRDIQMSKAVKKLGQVVVWGGVFASMVPEIALKEDYIDYVVIGEGELIAPRLAEAIASKQPPRDIPDVGWKDRGEIKINPPAQWAKDIDRFEPGWDLIDPTKYLRKFPYYEEYYWSFYFTRGCPKNCNYCYNRLDSRRKLWRIHSLEYCREQINYLKKTLPVQIKILSLVGDNLFGELHSAWNLIYGLNYPWAGVGRFEIVNPDFVSQAKETRAVYLGFGLESASEKMLKIYRKEITPQMAMDALERLASYPCFYDAGVIFLGPGEEQEDRQQTFKFMEQARKINPYLCFASNPFWVFPGTPLWEKCLKQGFIPPQNIEEWSQRFLDFMEVYGWSKRRWARAKTVLDLLYGLPRVIFSLPPGIHKALYHRLYRFEFKIPLEEIIRLSLRGVSRFRSWFPKKPGSPFPPLSP